MKPFNASCSSKFSLSSRESSSNRKPKACLQFFCHFPHYRRLLCDSILACLSSELSE